MSFAQGLKTIVVATELHGSSEAALEYARKLASAYGARIVLAHGMDPIEYATPGALPGNVAKRLPEEAQAAVATADSLAHIFQRPLLMLHARAKGEADQPAPCAITLEEFGLETSAEFPVRCIVKQGAPVDVVEEAIAENHPCILVAGVKRDSGTPGPHGTAFALLARSRVPVLCVPPEWSVISGQWSVISDQWSVISDQWSGMNLNQA
jgi:nucleotide-binding universal stress UspA family protein